MTFFDNLSKTKCTKILEYMWFFGFGFLYVCTQWSRHLKRVGNEEKNVPRSWLCLLRWCNPCVVLNLLMLLENLAPLPTKTVNYAWKNSCEICISSYSSTNRSVLQEHALFERLIDQKLLIKMRTKQTLSNATPPIQNMQCK